MISSIIFILVAAIAFGIGGRKFLQIRRNILLGKDYEVTGSVAERWKNVALIAFGQKKMFKKFIPALFHFFIYAAFLFTQIELLEIMIDGVFGVHRFFADKIGVLYTILINSIEILSMLAFVATLVFLARRNLLKVPRFWQPEMKGWPALDGNMILFLELVLLVGVFTMNGTDVLLQKLDPAHYPSTGNMAVSSWLGPMLFGGFEQSTLVILERAGWWLHILVVFFFLNYLPYSKHLHIILAFPNTYFAKLSQSGKIDNMPEIMNEVKGMMGIGDAPAEELPMDAELPEFGANDITGLTWKNIMDAYTCTECGRCTEQCPANQTGKKLSPRKIMMDVRDRAEEIGKNLDTGNSDFIAKEKQGEGVALSGANYFDGKSLFDSISREEIHACTTCNACVEACPVLINPLDIIVQLRRYEILTESAGPSDWLPMFNSIENGGAAWQMSIERDAWTKDLG